LARPDLDPQAHRSKIHQTLPSDGPAAVTPVPPIKRSALGDLTLFGSGGQGKVYRFAVPPPELSGVGLPLLYKEYDDKSRQELDADVLGRMVERGGRFDLRWLLQQGLAWPLAVVVDGPTTVGFLMQE